MCNCAVDWCDKLCFLHLLLIMPSLTWEIEECVEDVDPMLVVLDKLVGIQSANLRPNKTLSLLMLLIRIIINSAI